MATTANRRTSTSVSDYLRWANNGTGNGAALESNANAYNTNHYNNINSNAYYAPQGTAGNMGFHYYAGAPQQPQRPQQQPQQRRQEYRDEDDYYQDRAPMSGKGESNNLPPKSQSNPKGEAPNDNDLVSRSVPHTPPPQPTDKYVSSSSESAGTNKTTGGSSNPRAFDGMETQVNETVSDLITKLNSLINKNKSALDKKYAPTSSSAPGNDAVEIDKYKKEHDRTRKNMLALMDSIDSYNSSDPQSTINKLLPRWKHRLIGNTRPLPSEVLGGIRLFRVVARAVMVVMIRPRLAIRRRKLRVKDRQMSDLSRKIQFLADLCCSWLGKSVNVPFISIEHVRPIMFYRTYFANVTFAVCTQDSHVDFSFVGYSTESSLLGSLLCVGSGSNAALAQKILQLRVRVSAILRNITSSGLPPDHILEFLVTLTEDNNYFTDEMLWDHERAALQFDELVCCQLVFSMVVRISYEETMFTQARRDSAYASISCRGK
jgi:hypothetical protein